MNRIESQAPRQAPNALAPYADVARIFAGTVPRGKELARGGVDVAEKNSRSNAGVWNHRHVEMSFSNEQLPYITTTLAYLTALTRGHVISDEDQSVPTFSNRVESKYLNSKWNFGFDEAMTSATKDLLTDFKNFYPNLMPALDAIFKVAGAAGMSAAIDIGGKLSIQVRTGKMTQDNIDTYWGEDDVDKDFGNKHKAFTGIHNSFGRDGNATSSYEVWCSGEGLAREVIKQTKQAALNLEKSLSESGRHVYRHPNNFAEFELKSHMRTLSDEVAESQVKSSPTNF